MKTVFKFFKEEDLDFCKRFIAMRFPNLGSSEEGLILKLEGSSEDLEIVRRALNLRGVKIAD